MNLSKSVKVAIAYKGGTQKSLAESMKVTQATLTSWMKGKTAPNAFQIAQMAVYFDMKVSSFIELGE